MRKVVRRAACSSYARVAGYGFIARERLWCTELDRWVDADDGRTFGERGEPRAGVVPRLREEGVEPVLADVDLRPCAARDQHVDYLPTVTVGDSEGLPYQPFFDGATKRIMELSTGRGRPGGRSHPRVRDVTALKAPWQRLSRRAAMAGGRGRNRWQNSRDSNRAGVDGSGTLRRRSSPTGASTSGTLMPTWTRPSTGSVQSGGSGRRPR